MASKSNRRNVLFVCSMNQWRSPTAEKIYSDDSSINVRSCGTSRKAVKKSNSEIVKWADIICVMEQKHLRRLKGDFPGEIAYKEVHVLDIPDDYQFMDPELIQELKSAIDPILNQPTT